MKTRLVFVLALLVLIDRPDWTAPARRTWSPAAEQTRLACASFVWPVHVAEKLQVGRTTVYKHIMNFARTHVVERQRIRGRVEVRIGAMLPKEAV